MRRMIVMCIGVIAGLILLVDLSVEAGESDWKKIGSKTFKAEDSEESIRIGVEEGFYRWIKFGAEGGKIDFKQVTVRFVGGDKEVFENFTTVRDGGETRTITLATVAKKTISRIDFRYEIKGDADEVKVITYGRRDND